jgi:hypothetical protein
MRYLSGVMGRMGSIQREAAACQNTSRQVGSLSEETTLYRSVGKAYIKTNKAAQEAVLSAELETYDKNFKVKNSTQESKRRQYIPKKPFRSTCTHTHTQQQHIHAHTTTINLTQKTKRTQFITYLTSK